MKKVLPAVFLFVVVTQLSFSQSRPNIVVILCDDLTYNSFAFDGGPSFMQTPSIQRIADEGVRFQNFFCVYSLCTPSRATMLTGLYPHNNGAYGNFTDIHHSLPTTAKLLSAAGYHTAMIGKYQMATAPQSGWDYWLATPVTTNYLDPEMDYNGEKKTIIGHITDIVTDTTVSFLEMVDTPFFVWMSHQAPHYPFLPQSGNEHLFDDSLIYLPLNYGKFQNDYPSFLYSEGSTLFYDEPTDVFKQLNQYYACTYGIDASTKKVLETLEERGLLDNTLVIFTSDNGRFFGQHDLTHKKLPYDDAMRLPLYIRYPAWFTPHSVVGDSIALNLDIAPTILDAAGVTVPDDWQGTSLRKVANGTVERNEFMFEFIPTKDGSEEGSSGSSLIPSIRSVRSLKYQYNRYRCSEGTEEFFDMTNDPLQLHNLIHDGNYSSLVEQYRTKLDSFLLALHDTLTADNFILDCRLESSSDNTAAAVLTVQPNPTSGMIKVELSGALHQTYEMQLFNSIGQVIYRKTISLNDEPVYHEFIDIGSLQPGCYFIAVFDGKKRSALPVIRD